MLELIYLNHRSLQWELLLTIREHAGGYHLELYVDSGTSWYLLAEIWHVSDSNFAFSVQCLLEEIPY